jgi:hypothetical protein
MTTEGKKDHRHAVIYGPLVRGAVHASGEFSMILRNGANYLSQFKSTLALLQEKTKLVRFSMGSQNETLLHFAAHEAHDEACEIILESGWRIEELDLPAGPAGLTPLLESGDGTGAPTSCGNTAPTPRRSRSARTTSMRGPGRRCTFSRSRRTMASWASSTTCSPPRCPWTATPRTPSRPPQTSQCAATPFASPIASCAAARRSTPRARAPR